MYTPATIVINGRGIIQYANESLLAQSGFALAQVVDKSPKHLWGGHMPRQVYSKLWKTISSGNPYVVTMKNKSKRGSWYKSQLHVMPVKDTLTDSVYFVGVDTSTSTRPINTEQFLHVWRSGTEYEKRMYWNKLFHVEKPVHSLHTWITEVWIDPIQTILCRRYTDAEIIAQAQQDNSYFSTLFHKYHSSVYRYILSKVYDQSVLAEDLTQETFLKAFQYLPTYTAGYATYQTYLYRIAYTRIVDYLRNQKIPTQSLDATSESVLVDIKDRNPVDLHFMLARAQQLLTPAEYQAIEAFYIYNDSIHDISVGMARSQNAVKLLLSRARKKLAQRLSCT